MSLVAQKNWKVEPLTLTIGISGSGKTCNAVLILQEMLSECNQEKKDIAKAHKNEPNKSN